ncbi:MAG TPA: class I SAM-dependent methyltransferase [Bryobacteraceae bacterium]|nr:class I SAM-dependent methyltransferase [Bryobacteraceae bacterium]
MPGRAIVQPYRWLAEHYDQVFGGYRKFIEAAHRAIVDPILPGVRIACDLACGTGTTALDLAARGIRMYSVDLSAGMCRAARGKARERKLALRVIQADMRDFRLPEPVDLILCEYDALNHVPLHSDLRRVSRAVARVLNPGGWFFFDVNNMAGFKQYWRGACWIEKPGIVLVMRNGHDLRRRRAWCDCEWFVREERLWRRHTERVEEVCWTEDEIRSVLTAAEFAHIEVWDAAPFRSDGVTTEGCRSFFLARKRPLSRSRRQGLSANRSVRRQMPGVQLLPDC